MNSRIAFAFILASILIITSGSAAGQDSSQPSEVSRKVLTRVPPQYPAIARKMNIKGTVKMLVWVAPNGSPKSIEVKGGNPVLAQSAEKALREWKWEPAAHATSEVIDLRFDLR